MYLSGNGVASHPQFNSFSLTAMKNRCEPPLGEKNVYFQYRLDGLKQKGRLCVLTQTALFGCKTRFRRIFQYNVSP